MEDSIMTSDETLIARRLSQSKQTLELDPAITDDDGDSTYADDALTDTTSIASWIRDYRVENGRTYHSLSEGKYWGSNDEEAAYHNDIGHTLYLKTLAGSLFIAPVANPSNVLDLGTGTGIWAIDVADAYPAANVIGTDLSPMQPTWVPPNVAFEIDDMDEEWTYAPDSFDLIHLRGLQGSIQNWSTLYRQIYTALKPDGYVERKEYGVQFVSDDNSIPPNGSIATWNRLGSECLAILKLDLHYLDNLGQQMRDAGFEDVTEHRFKWPIGPWAKDPALKDLGLWCRAHVDSGLENWTMRLLTQMLGWTAEEVYGLCAGVRNELKDPKVHAIHEMRVVFARKPSGNPDTMQYATPMEM